MHEKIPDFYDTELWVIRATTTGHDEPTGFGECVTTRLPVQADHAAKHAADPCL